MEARDKKTIDWMMVMNGIDDWIGLDWIGLDWIGWDWIGLDWIGLDWIGLDWIGLESIKRLTNSIGIICFVACSLSHTHTH